MSRSIDSVCHTSAAYAAMLAMTSPDPDLNVTDRAIYAWLVWRANGDRICWKGIAEIMAEVNVGTRHTVHRALRKLKDKGLIGSKRALRQVNHYAILDPDGRLYGQTDWEPPWKSDVAESAHQVPDVAKPTRKTAPDVAKPAYQDVAKSTYPDVAKSTQESSSTENQQEGRVVVLRTTSPAAAVAPLFPDIRQQLWSEGRTILRDLTGQLNGQAGKQIGAFLKRANGDCAVVLDALRAAQREGPHEPVPWVVAAIQARLTPRSDFDPSKLSGAQKAMWNIVQERRALEAHEQECTA